MGRWGWEPRASDQALDLAERYKRRPLQLCKRRLPLADRYDRAGAVQALLQRHPGDFDGKLAVVPAYCVKVALADLRATAADRGSAPALRRAARQAARWFKKK